MFSSIFNMFTGTSPQVAEKVVERTLSRTSHGQKRVPVLNEKVSAVMGRVVGSIAQAVNDTNMTQEEQIFVMAKVIESHQSEINSLNASFNQSIVSIQSRLSKLDKQFESDLDQLEKHYKASRVNPAYVEKTINNARVAHRLITENAKLKLANDQTQLTTLFDNLAGIKQKAEGMASTPTSKVEKVAVETTRQFMLKTLEGQLPRLIQALPLLAVRLSVPQLALVSVAVAMVDTLTTKQASKAELLNKFNMNDGYDPFYEDTIKRSASNFTSNLVQNIAEKKLGWFGAVLVSSAVSSQLEQLTSTSLTQEQVEQIVNKFLASVEKQIAEKEQMIDLIESSYEKVNQIAQEALIEKQVDVITQMTKENDELQPTFKLSIPKFERPKFAPVDLLLGREMRLDIYSRSERKKPGATPRGPGSKTPRPRPTPRRRPPTTRTPRIPRI